MNKKAQIKKAIGLDKRVWINLGLWKTTNDVPLQSPKPTITFTSLLGQNVDLGEA